MNPWRRILFHTLPRNNAVLKNAVTPLTTMKTLTAPLQRKIGVNLHGFGAGSSNIISINGAAAAARGWRFYGTAPKYVVTRKVGGRTPKLVKADGRHELSGGFARYNKNQHHELRPKPQYWDGAVWFVNGKPRLYKFPSYTPGKNLDELASIIRNNFPQSCLPLAETTEAAAVEAAEAAAAAKSEVGVVAEVTANRTANNLAITPKFTLTEYNSWLKSDRAPKSVQLEPKSENPTVESIDLNILPAWYKKVSLRHVEDGISDQQQHQQQQQQHQQQQQQQSRQSTYSAVPAWQWSTDFNAVLQKIQALTKSPSNGATATSMRISNSDIEETKMAQIVIDFDKRRWLQLPPRTHFLRPKSVEMSEASLRNFSTSCLGYVDIRRAAGSHPTLQSLQSASSASSLTQRRLLTTGRDIRTVDDALENLSRKPVRYFVVKKPVHHDATKADHYASKATNTSKNNDNNNQISDRNNNSADQPTLNDVIEMIISPRSPAGGPRPEVVVRPPNVPAPKQFVKVNRAFLPVEDNVEVLPSAASGGDSDEHNWWIPVVAGAGLLALMYPLLGWYLSRDACPIFIREEKDDPAPMVGKYHTSLPVKMKDIKKAEVVHGRPQKDHMKTWSDIEKNWNTQGPDATHLGAGAGAAPAQGPARFGAASGLRRVGGNGGNFEADEEEEELAPGEEVRLRRDVNLRRNMRLEMGRADKCKDKDQK